MGKEISILHQHSARLMQLITDLDGGSHVETKLALMSDIAPLMPGGRPAYIELRKYKRLSGLIEKLGRATIQKVVFLLIKDYCSGLNLIRNMNEDQMIECAAMIIDEFSSFRLEELVVFFSCAKRGKFGKILDHVDMNTISVMLDIFDLESAEAWLQEKENPVKRLDSLGNTKRAKEYMHSQDVRMNEKIENLGGALAEMKYLTSKK